MAFVVITKFCATQNDSSVGSFGILLPPKNQNESQ